MNKSIFGHGIMGTTCMNDHKIENEDETFKHKKINIPMRKKIQTARMNAGLNQKELAQKLNVKTAVIQSYENGKAIPLGKIIQQIEQACKLEYGSISGKTRGKKSKKKKVKKKKCKLKLIKT